MPRARQLALGCLGAAVLATALFAPSAARGATPAPDASPTPELSLTGDGATFELHPGAPSFWQVGVTTRAVRLTRLVAALSAAGPLAETKSAPGATAATLSLASCSTPWQDDRCASGARRLLAATPLARLAADERSLDDNLSSDPEVPAHVYLLATVLLPSGAHAGGKSAVVTIRVSAAGDPAVAAVDDPIDGEATDPPGRAPLGDALEHALDGALASTGTRIGIWAALAATAVGAGALLAALARRRRPTRPEEQR